MTAVLLDGHTGKTLDLVEDLGEFGGIPIVVLDGAGFRILMNRRWLVDQVGGEFAVVDWMVIKERKDRIAHEWETVRK